MSGTRQLELELEVAVADALRGGPATDIAAMEAERNMRTILDRWLSQGRMPRVKSYRLAVICGRGLEVDLSFDYHKVVKDPQISLSQAK